MVELRVLAYESRNDDRHWIWPTEHPDYLEFLDGRVPVGSRLRPKIGASICRMLTMRADAILLYGWHSGWLWLMMLLARARGIPTTLFYESTTASHRFRRGPVAWARRAFFRAVDSILTPGPAATEAVTREGVQPSQIVTSVNTVDVSLINGASSRLRRRPGIGAGHTYLYVGQLIERKNVQEALRAFSKIAHPDDRFRIVGAGPLYKELTKCLKSLALEEQVRLIGHKTGEALLAEFADADTLILPSKDEVWGLVVNEALAAGCHAVVSDRAGVASTVAGMTGVYIASPNAESIGEGMTMSRAEWRGPILRPEILAHSPERLARDTLTAVQLAGRRCRSGIVARNQGTVVGYSSVSKDKKVP